MLTAANATNKRAVEEQFSAQSGICERLGSPFTANLLATALSHIEPDSQLSIKLFDWPRDPTEDALALRFAAALHALSLNGAIPALHKLGTAETERALPFVLRDHQSFIADFITHPPQTNEVARAAVLTPGFLTIAHLTGLPLRLLEIGSSAGLNQLWPHWRYRFNGQFWGPENAPVSLQPDWQGETPALTPVSIASSNGADIRPINIRDRAERTRLMSYVWPDQEERLDRLQAALAFAQDHPPSSEQADAGDWLASKLVEPVGEQITVIYHSVVWQYFSDTTRRACHDAMHKAVQEGKAVAWLRMEPDETRSHCELKLDLLHEGSSHHLADSHFHGAWIRWHGNRWHGIR